MEPLNKIPRILIEQDSDPVSFNFKTQMLGLHSDEQILKTNPRDTHYCRNKKRILIKDDIYYRQNYKDIGDSSQTQVLLQKAIKRHFN